MMTIGRLSDQARVKIETIRYYERIGLLAAPDRSSGGHRLYDAGACDRLVFIRRGRELGFSLEEIKSLLTMAESAETETAGGARAACADVRDLTLRHLKSVRARIADLRRLERTLAVAAKHCDSDESAHCPIIEALAVNGR